MYNNVFTNIVPFMRYLEKYGIPIQATYDNMAHAHCMLGT